MLKQLTSEFRVVSPPIVESYPDKGMASKVARLWAQRKAESVASLKESKDAFILAADSVVGRHRAILGTPDTPEQADEMLEQLDGRRFTITTALCVINPHKKLFITHQTTRLTLARLGSKTRAIYIASNAWQKRAGGLDLAGKAGVFVRTMNGLWSNALGLPLWHTRELLMTAGMQQKQLTFAS